MFQYFKLDIILKQDQIFFRHGYEKWLRIKTLIIIIIIILGRNLFTSEGNLRGGLGSEPF